MTDDAVPWWVDREALNAAPARYSERSDDTIRVEIDSVPHWGQDNAAVVDRAKRAILPGVRPNVRLRRVTARKHGDLVDYLVTFERTDR